MNLKSISNIRKYLHSWIEEGRCPQNFMNLEFIPEKRAELIESVTHLCSLHNIIEEIKKSPKIDTQTVIYLLGIYLYKNMTGERYNGELTHKAIKKPRIYQFLKVVLEENRDNRIVKPNSLHSLLYNRRRDTIMGTAIKGNGYIIEPFSTIGLTRQQNQDYIGYYEFQDAIVLIVADGVGGGENGEVASQLTTSFIIDSLKSYSFSNESDGNIEKILRNLVFESNQKVLDYARQNGINKMGTTLSMALIVNQSNLFIAHIGDSRIYELEDRGEPKQLTPDHSYPEVLYRQGKITEKEKANYKKNILVYVLGKDNLKKEDIFIQHSYLFDKSLLLCSDGLWERMGVTSRSFRLPFEQLKEEIFNSVPTDNVSIIRYFPSQKEEIRENKNYYDVDTKPPSLKNIKQSPTEKSRGKELIILEKKKIKQEEEEKLSMIDKNHDKMIKALLGVVAILLLILAFVFLSVSNSDTPSPNPVVENEKKFFNAVQDGNSTQIENLIKSVDINSSYHGHLAIDYAYKKMDIKTIKLLVKYGIDKNRTMDRVEEDINKTAIKFQKLKAIQKVLMNGK